MKFFHIHSSLAALPDPIPYLILAGGDNGRMSLDFSQLERDVSEIVATVALSKTALYEVLEGKSLYVDRNEDSIRLQAETDELIIECHSKEGVKTYRVWLAELALGWNLLSGFDSVDLPAA